MRWVLQYYHLWWQYNDMVINTMGQGLQTFKYLD